MTIVIGSTDGTTVRMAADTLSSSKNAKYVTFTSKLIKHRNILIGIAGTWSGVQYIKHEYLPTIKKNVPKGAEEKFVYGMMKSILSGASDEFAADKESLSDLELIIGVNGRLFNVQTTTILEPYERVSAIGSGSEYALGAYKSLTSHEEFSNLTPLSILIRCADIATYLNPSCGGHIDFEEIS